MRAIAPILALGTVLVAGSAVAQTAGPPFNAHPYAVPYGATVTIGDIHRYEMDRLRAQADADQALANVQALQTQQTLNALQAARQPSSPPAYASDRPLTREQARRLSETTEARTSAQTRATGQIDAWLDRPQP